MHWILELDAIIFKKFIFQENFFFEEKNIFLEKYLKNKKIYFLKFYFFKITCGDDEKNSSE